MKRVVSVSLVLVFYKYFSMLLIQNGSFSSNAKKNYGLSIIGTFSFYMNSFS